MTTFGCGCKGTVHDVGCYVNRQTLTPMIITEGPPSVRTFGPCIKCGWDDIGVSYHPGHPIGCTEWTCREWRRVDEHLSLFCRRCQYRWLEDVS